MTHGKCTDCKVYWFWSGKPLLREAGCPECGKSLERTSRLLQGYTSFNLHTLERAPQQAAA